MLADFEPGLVSVIVPTFNRADLIGETLRSVVAQTYRPIELVVVDDGSTDCTREVVERFAGEAGPDLRVRYVAQENRGVSAARNRGLVESRGEFIQYLDSDDLLRADKLALQVGELARRPELDFVYSGSAMFSEIPDDSATPYTGLPTSDPLVTCVGSHPLPWRTDSGVYRRRLCVEAGPWDESLYCWEDWEYHCRVCLATDRIGYVPGTMSFVRSAGHGQITGTEFTSGWIRAGATAVARIHAALVDHDRLRHRDVSDALAMACFHIARRAADGEGRLHERLMGLARSLRRNRSTRVLHLLWDGAVRTIGGPNAGAALAWALDSTLRMRRSLRSARSSP